MARIAGVDLPNKAVKIALTYIYGVGRSTAVEACRKAGVESDKRMNDLSADDINKLRKILENDYTVEGRLRTQVSMNIKRLMDIGCYRGLRHRRGLPVNGQRTKNNSRTRKGKRKTVAGKKKAV
jgi:small subunit ribosomal protein S13